MDQSQLETLVISLRDEVKSLQRELASRGETVRELQDTEAIKRLQAAYGYYMEHAMVDEVIDCFSTSDDVSASFAEGTYLGPAGIRRHFERLRNVPPSFLHMVMQVSPYITVMPGGERAQGRWYGYGNLVMRDSTPLDPAYISVIYEMDYVKEDGTWKILGMRQNMTFLYSHGAGDSEGTAPGKEPARPPVKLGPDIPAEFDTEYPSGYIMPMHFVHPVTGKTSSEAARNARLKLGPSKRAPRRE